VLGIVDTDRVVYYRDVVKRHSARSEFDITQVSALPRVDILMTYQGAPGDLIRASADQGARGIVIATAAGATSGTQADGIRYAREKQVVVVRSTRTGAGRIAAPRRPAPAAAGPTSTASGNSTGNGNGNAQTGPTGSSNGSGSGATNGAPTVFASTVAAEDLSPIKSRILLMLALTRTSNPDDVQRMFQEY